MGLACPPWKLFIWVCSLGDIFPALADIMQNCDSLMVCLDTNEEESSHLGFHLALKLLPANLGHLQFFARIIMCLISSSLVHVREMYIVLKRGDTEHSITPVSRHPKVALKQSRHRDLCSFFPE